MQRHNLLLLEKEFPEEDVFLPSSDNILRFLACRAPTNPQCTTITLLYLCICVFVFLHTSKQVF